MKRVIVVESGAKTKTIRGFLRGEYDVVACGGHIADLPDDELGIDVDHDFGFEVVPTVERGRDKVESIRSKLDDADEVILATDPDREGEAIAADIERFAVPPGADVSRIEFNAIVYPAVKEALENPRTIDRNRVEAQRARRSLDRLIGFIVSSMAKFDPEGPHVPSVGRVQSPAVGIVVDREDEIRAFEPRKYWTLHGSVAWNDHGLSTVFEGEWEGFSDVKTVVDDLTDRGELTVTRCRVDPEDERHPLPPYTTDALQNDADYLLNLSPERTMGIAQELYQGIDVDGESRALITYMRTDSTRVSPSALNMAKRTLAAREDLGEEMYRGRTWQTQGPAQDAHEAIRPTSPDDEELWPENLEGHIPDEHLELYRLIYLRFLASQMVPAVYRTTELTLEAGEHRAVALGHELQEEGFLKVWREVRPDHGYDEVAVPELEEGTVLELQRAWPEPQETRPPGRYREGSLVSELKDRGIGRPSTYQDILRKIKRRGGNGYVRKAGGTLRPTDKGEDLVEYLRRKFQEIVDYEYTAKMEDALDRIEEGELTYEEFLGQEFQWLRAPFEYAKEQGWMDSDLPTPKQIEYLDSLAEEAGADVPKSVYESKREVSEWIDKLQDEIDPVIKLTPIYEADVGGVNVHRFQLRFNRQLPDEEYEHLRESGLRYQRGGKDQLPCFQYQRQDRKRVEELWQEFRARYREGRGELEGFDFIEMKSA